MSEVRLRQNVLDELEFQPNIDATHVGVAEATDDEIADRIANILTWDAKVPPNAVQVMVRDGWVTLTGIVEWQFQRCAAEEGALKLSGVRGISNKIELRSAAQVADIKTRIEEALRRRIETEAKRVNVVLEGEGNVVLEGKVENWDKRIAITNAAWSAPGVKSVVDRLTFL